MRHILLSIVSLLVALILFDGVFGTTILKKIIDNILQIQFVKRIEIAIALATRYIIMHLYQIRL